MIWAGRVARMGAKTITYRILVENPQRVRPVFKTRYKCEDNIKTNFRERELG
jgi:hypothetical protein